MQHPPKGAGYQQPLARTHPESALPAGGRCCARGVPAASPGGRAASWGARITGPATGCDGAPVTAVRQSHPRLIGTAPLRAPPCVALLPLPGPGGSCPQVLLQLLVDKARRGLPGSHLGLQGPLRSPGPTVPPGWGGPALPPSGSGPRAPWLDARRLLPEKRAFLQGTWEQAFLVGGGAGRWVPGIGVPGPGCEEGFGGLLGGCGGQAVFPSPSPPLGCWWGSPSSRLLALPSGGGQTAAGWLVVPLEPPSPAWGPPSATHVPFPALASACGAARGALCPRARGSRCPRR